MRQLDGRLAVVRHDWKDRFEIGSSGGWMARRMAEDSNWLDGFRKYSKRWTSQQKDREEESASSWGGKSGWHAVLKISQGVAHGEAVRCSWTWCQERRRQDTKVDLQLFRLSIPFPIAPPYQGSRALSPSAHFFSSSTFAPQIQAQLADPFIDFGVMPWRQRLRRDPS